MSAFGGQADILARKVDIRKVWLVPITMIIGGILCAGAKRTWFWPVLQ